MTRQRVSTKVAVAILLITVLLAACLLCFFTPVTSAETDIATTTAAPSAEEDYSEYTDKELPDTINFENILQIVPAELFNRGDGPHIYNGKSYGFIIYCEAGINYILLFKIDVEKEPIGDVYKNRLSVKYDGAFEYSETGGAEVASTTKRLMLSDVTFSEVIVDISYNNVLSPYYDMYSDDGPIFISTWQGESLETYYDKEHLIDLGTGYLKSIFVGAANIFAPGLGTAFDIIFNTGDYISAVVDNWEQSATSDTVINYPATAQAQLESDVTGHKLKKSIVVGNDEKVANVLSYENGKGGYLTICTRTINPNNKSFYLSTAFNFDIGLYGNFGSVSDLGNYTASGAYAVENGTTEYTEMTGSETEGFNLNEKPFFAPLLKGESFTFTPDITGEYSIGAPDGYVCKLRNSDGVEVESSSGGNFNLTAGQTYSVGICTEYTDVDWNKISDDDYYSSGEFLGGESAFASVQVRRVQDLPFAEDSTASGTVQSGITYAWGFDDANNDLFKISASDISDLTVYLADKNLNILSKGASAVGDKCIYVNYPLTEEYYLILVNNGEPISLTVEDTGALIAGEDELICADTGGLYYKVEAKYTQNYTVKGAHTALFNSSMTALTNDNGYYLTPGTYYIKSYNGTGLNLYISDSAFIRVTQPGQEFTVEGNENAAYRLSAQFDGKISLVGTYDIYINGVLDGEGVSQTDIRKNNIYDFVKTDGGTTFEFTPVSTNIDYNEIKALTQASEYAMYKFSVTSSVRVYAESSDNLQYSFYSEDLTEVSGDKYGYLLTAGTYYLVVGNGGDYSFKVTEKLTPISVTFIVDGEIFEDVSGATYYYGKPFSFPVPHKDYYDFDGWKNSDGITITDADGESIAPIYAESIQVTAAWVSQSVILQFRTSETGQPESYVWYNGNEFVGEEYTLNNTADISRLLGSLANLYITFTESPSGVKTGKYITSFQDPIIENVPGSEHTYRYKFIPVWETEKYYLLFVLDNKLAYIGLVSYGEKVGRDVFPAAEYTDTKERDVTGWYLSGYEDIIIMLPQDGETVTIPDLSPGIGTEPDYPQDGKLGYACTILPVYEYNPYKTVTVFNASTKIYEGESYKILTLGQYGQNTSVYTGMNIWYTGSNGKTYYEGNSVLYSEFSGNLELSLQSKYATVKVAYTNCDTNPNKTVFTFYSGPNGSAETLQPAYKRTYQFSYWSCNGVTITQITPSSLGITGYYSTAASPVNSTPINIDANHTRKEISGAVIGSLVIEGTDSCGTVFVDCSAKLFARSVKYIIRSSVKEITFHDKGRSWSDISISIDSRSTPLVINFDGISSLKGYANKGVIYATSCPDLTVYAMTDVSIRAGEINAVTPSKIDNAAIMCKNLTLAGENISATGGTYITFGLLTSPPSLSSAGIYSVGGTLNITTKSVKVYGGNGRNGIDATSDSGERKNGYAGINGDYALEGFSKIVISNGATAIFTGGNGGKGGAGINGGSKGLDGAGAPAVSGNPVITGICTKNNGRSGVSYG